MQHFFDDTLGTGHFVSCANEAMSALHRLPVGTAQTHGPVFEQWRTALFTSALTPNGAIRFAHQLTVSPHPSVLDSKMDIVMLKLCEAANGYEPIAIFECHNAQDNKETQLYRYGWNVSLLHLPPTVAGPVFGVIVHDIATRQPTIAVRAYWHVPASPPHVAMARLLDNVPLDADTLARLLHSLQRCGDLPRQALGSVPLDKLHAIRHGDDGRVYKTFDYRQYRNLDGHYRRNFLAYREHMGDRARVELALLEQRQHMPLQTVPFDALPAVVTELQQFRGLVVISYAFVEGTHEPTHGTQVRVVVLELDRLHAGRLCHGDIRASNIVFATDHASSCLIDLDMAGRPEVARYPLGYNVAIDDAKRHPGATSLQVLQFEHDRHSLHSILQRFEPTSANDSQAWSTFLERLRGGDVSLKDVAELVPLCALQQQCKDFQSLAPEALKATSNMALYRHGGS